jgi:predicted transcriptional regulator
MIPSATMTLAEVRDLLPCEVVVDPGTLETTTVSVAGGADLMSDVLAFIQPGALLLTGLTNAQSVRTAIVADVTAIVYVRDKKPDADAVALAKEARLPLLRTPLTLYEACGRLYGAGLPGCVLEPRGKRGEDGLHPPV